MFFLEFCRKRLGTSRVCDGFACADTLDHAVLRRLLRRVQAVAGDEAGEFQPHEQLVQGRLVIRLHKAGLR